MGEVDLLQVLGPGAVGVLALFATWWHRDAIRTHEQRADDAREVARTWQAIAERERQISEERANQLNHMLTAVRESALHATAAGDA